jgi:hypothetical protein
VLNLFLLAILIFGAPNAPTQLAHANNGATTTIEKSRPEDPERKRDFESDPLPPKIDQNEAGTVIAKPRRTFDI